MKFDLALITLAIATLASASPAMEGGFLEARKAKGIDCPSGYQPMCCDGTGVGGILATQCQDIARRVKTLKKFKKHCKARASTPLCCSTTLIGASLSCVAPS